MSTFRERLGLAVRALFPKQAGDAMTRTTGDSILSGILGPGRTPAPRTANDFLEAYSRLPWLRAIVGKIAYSISSIEWQVGAARRGSRYVRDSALMQACDHDVRKEYLRRRKLAGEFRLLEGHPLTELLHNANPFLTGMATRKLLQAHLDLTGEHFWVLERNVLGFPFRVWPISPSWVMRTPSPTWPFYEVRFQAYHDIIPAEDVVAFKDDDPANPYGRGVGVSLALGDDLEADEYAAKHVKTRFFNRAIPELMVTLEGAGDTAVKRAERRWLQKTQGLFRQLVPYFTNAKMDVKQLGESFRALQLTQLREFERDLCIQVFGVPPEIFGILSSSNRATIREAKNLYAQWVLVPRLELIRSVIQERLAPMFDDRLVVDYVSPVREDFEDRKAAMSAAPWAYQMDDWRELAGCDPVGGEEGKLRAVPNNVRIVDSLLPQEVTAPPAAPPEDQDDPPGNQPPPAAPARQRARELEAVLGAMGLAS